jgi:transcriptional regulator with PAS, ATPase and Fis domain
LRQTVEKARVLADVGAPVLLQGETGVGKEVFARAIHEGGRFRGGPFVAVNCGGLPRDLLASELFGYLDGAFTGARRSGMVGRIEAAHDGTLFLDEIGEMPLDLQPYLLRCLEGGEVYPLGSNRPRTVRFRLIAASNRDLRAHVAAGRFRMDLYYRVSVTSLHIPALREHVQDIPALVAHFCREVTERYGLLAKTFAPEVLAMLARHPWPGNLRELRNLVAATLLLTVDDIVQTTALPPEFAGAGEGGECAGAEGLARVERNAIDAAIRTYRGNLAGAARSLHIAKSTLYLKMRKYALEPMLHEVRVDAADVAGRRPAWKRFAQVGDPSTSAGRRRRSLTSTRDPRRRHAAG